MSEAAKNRAKLEDLDRRLAAVRDKLATVAAQAGPLFREVAEIEEGLRGILGSAVSAPSAPPPSPPAAEAMEFVEGDGEGA